MVADQTLTKTIHLINLLVLFPASSSISLLYIFHSLPVVSEWLFQWYLVSLTLVRAEENLENAHPIDCDDGRNKVVQTSQLSHCFHGDGKIHLSLVSLLNKMIGKRSKSVYIPFSPFYVTKTRICNGWYHTGNVFSLTSIPFRLHPNTTSIQQRADSLRRVICNKSYLVLDHMLGLVSLRLGMKCSLGNSQGSQHNTAMVLVELAPVV